MKTNHHLLSRHLPSFAALGILLVPVLGHADTKGDAKTSPSTKSIKVDRIGRSAEVKIPEGCSRLTIEYRTRGSLRWQTYKTLSPSGKAEVLKLDAPKGVLISDWRATATISPIGVQPAKAAVPRSFFQGQRSFAKSVSETYDRLESATNLGSVIGTALASGPIWDEASRPLPSFMPLAISVKRSANFL